MENIEALADGSGLDDGAVTSAKLATDAGGGAWQTWTPTLSGVSGTPTVNARYMKIGNTVHCSISVAGTGNATTKFFTLPFPANDANDSLLGFSSNADGGSNYIGTAIYRTATPNVQVYRGLTGGTGSPFTSWAASGSMSYSSRFTYETS